MKTLKTFMSDNENEDDEECREVVSLFFQDAVNCIQRFRTYFV